jgi:hypothetical protein
VRRVLPLFSAPRFWRRAVAILAPLLGLALASWVQAFFSAAALELPACSNSDAGGITPLTGILVLSDTLTTGHGCGTGPDQIFEYATIVSIPENSGPFSGAYVTGGTTPCFTNATFDNVCTYNTNSNYDITIYAFNQTEWNQTLDPDGGSTVTAILNQNNGVAAPVDDAGCNDRVQTTTIVPQVNGQAGWTTTCTAKQQVDAPVTALCAPLEPISP